MMMTQLIRPFVTAGIAVAGAGLWLAVAPDAVAAPADGAPCGDFVCSDLFGSAASVPTPPKLAAAEPNPIGSLIRVFIGNGTADNPNAGLLIGNGWDATDAQDGGNGGLLFGRGGVGGTGGTGAVGQAGKSG
jgi:hypothetical protein